MDPAGTHTLCRLARGIELSASCQNSPPSCATLVRMADRLTLDEVRRVALLARLSLSDEELELYRTQLASILDHIARLEHVDVEDVEPLAHPHDLTNRLEADEVAPSMPRDRVLEIAPAVEESFLAVPKVLDHGGGA